MLPNRTVRQRHWLPLLLRLVALGIILGFAAPIQAQDAPGTLDLVSGTVVGPDPSDFQTAALQPDGKILIAGGFSYWSGLPRPGIVRMNVDGTVDRTFAPIGGIDVRAGELIQQIVVLPSGQILIGGNFTNYDGVAVPGLARLNADGSLDPTFTADIVLDGYVPAVEQIALLPRGQILIAGDFAAADGATALNIARLNADGSRDESFRSPGFDPAGRIDALAAQSDGQILIGGDFVDVGGVARYGLARLNWNGSLDGSFDPGAGAHQVYVIVPVADGQVLVGGSFKKYAGDPSARYLLRLNADGTRDRTFAAQVDAQVEDIAVTADGDYVLGGWFSRVDGVSRLGVARIHADGTLDATFDPTGGPAPHGAHGPVYVVIPQADGQILIGGNFAAQGSLIRSNVMWIGGEQ